MTGYLVPVACPICGAALDIQVGLAVGVQHGVDALAVTTRVNSADRSRVVEHVAACRSAK